MAKKKLTEKSKLLRFPMFNGYSVEIVVTNDAALSAKKRGCVRADDYVAVHLYHEDLKHSSIIVPSRSSAATIAHECWHCARRILMSIDADLENEIVAYLITHLVSEVYRLKRRRAKLTKSPRR